MHLMSDREKTDHLALAARIEAIDPEAADYLRSIPDLPEKTRLRIGFCPTRELFTTMHWVKTPQGHDYWEGIATQLGEG